MHTMGIIYLTIVLRLLMRISLPTLAHIIFGTMVKDLRCPKLALNGADSPTAYSVDAYLSLRLCTTTLLPICCRLTANNQTGSCVCLCVCATS